MGPWRVGAVVRQCGAGRPAATRKTIGVAEILWLGYEALLCKKRTKYYLSLKFRQNLPCTVRYPKPAKNIRHDG